MFLFRLALLNIFRNPRRSVITTLAVAVGVGAMIFLWAFHDGAVKQMQENVIYLFTGHAQVHAKGYDQRLSPEKYIRDRAEVLTAIEGQKGVVAVTERAKCEALIGTTENSRGILLIGIDPQRESRITRLSKHIQKGVFLSNGKNRELILGDRLAEKMGLSVGDKAVLMTQSMDGTLAGYSYRVAGIFHTGSMQVDLMAAYITLDACRELLDIGGASHEIVVRLDGLKTIESFVSGLRARLDPALYEVMSWDEIIPEPNLWVKWYQSVMRTVLITVMIVIAVGIMNTILMSVFERTRELGVMMAIGTSPYQIILLILLETLFLEFVGIALGIACGCFVSAYFGQVGIHFQNLERALSQSFVSTVTYPVVRWSHVCESAISLLLITTLISLYPAIKASRMRPVEAIYKR